MTTVAKVARRRTSEKALVHLKNQHKISDVCVPQQCLTYAIASYVEIRRRTRQNTQKWLL